jgi:hypothetical protein
MLSGDKEGEKFIKAELIRNLLYTSYFRADIKKPTLHGPHLVSIFKKDGWLTKAQF